MCDPFYFDGISDEAFTKVTADLAEQGFHLNGPSGTVSGPFGIVLDYEWRSMSQSLKVVVREKNFFVSCEQIKERLAKSLSKYAHA